ncbi:MAG: GNAT family N-acetyltransferase [Chitinophagaceae bacterium]|nr:GNAT family N-acetyltransferase [Anaerolineae bacterium]
MVLINGLQICLRDFVLSDLEILTSWLQGHPRWKELDAPYYPINAQQASEMIELRRTKIEAGNWPHPRFRLAIATLESNRFIGEVSRSWISQETDWPEVGIVIYDPDYWGCGIGYEALGLWSDTLFDGMPEIVRLDLRTWSGNHGMIRLAQKLGYQQEACFRKARIVKGDYFDGLGYGVLREEWRGLYPDRFAAHLQNRV